MAISHVASSVVFNTNFWSGNNLVGTEPSGAAVDDFLVATVSMRHGSSVITGPSGWTKVDQVDQSTLQVAKYTIKRGSSAPDYDWVASLPTSSGIVDAAVVIDCFRGVDTTTPLDVTYVQGTHYFGKTSGIDMDPPSIDTVTNGAFVHTSNGVRLGTMTVAPVDTIPSGYTLGGEYMGVTLGVIVQTAFKEVVSFGTEDPGVFTHTTNASGDYTHHGSFTLALRPAAGGATNPKGPLGLPFKGPFGGPI
jgi:hypothetical protein